MKQSIFQQFAKRHLLTEPEFASFECRKNLVFRVPVGLILGGMACGAASHEAEAFVISVFAQPLYIPDDVISLSLGYRVRDSRTNREWRRLDPKHPESWRGVAQAIVEDLRQRDAFAFIERLQTPRGVARYLEDVGYHPHNVNLHEIAAYSYLLSEDYGRGLAKIDAALTAFAELGYGASWEAAQLERLQSIKGSLEKGTFTGLERAREMLLRWRAESLRALKLNDVELQGRIGSS